MSPRPLSSRSALRVALFLVVFLFFFGASYAAQDEAPRLSDAQKKIIRITESGLSPRELPLTKGDSSVFVFNDLDSSAVKIRIKFGDNKLHCHSPGSKIDEEGFLNSHAPTPANSFFIACFPEKADYDYEVTVLETGKVFRGQITLK